MVRPGAKYRQSLQLLKSVHEFHPAIATKSGMMLGLGESWAEVLETMRELADHDCEILTLGQYLQPSRDHLPIARYYSPDEFAELKREGEARMGFRHVEAGPLVRSSYHARSQLESVSGACSE